MTASGPTSKIAVEGNGAEHNLQSIDLWMGRFTTGNLLVGGRSLIVGGNWNNGDKAGVGYANANNDLSNSNNNIGARLIYIHLKNKEKITVMQTLSMKIGKKQETKKIWLVPTHGNVRSMDVGWCV